MARRRTFAQGGSGEAPRARRYAVGGGRDDAGRRGLLLARKSQRSAAGRGKLAPAERYGRIAARRRPVAERPDRRSARRHRHHTRQSHPFVSTHSYPARHRS